MGKKILRLHVWGTTRTTLPTLDPTSLYAASLLCGTFAHREDVTLQLASASTSLVRVPLLQVLNEQDETVEMVDEVEAIRAFCAAAGLEASLASDAEKEAKATALHALLDDQLLDLALHSLFSLPANFRTVTAPAYSSVGGVDAAASSNPLLKLASLPMRFQPSIPSRLRNAVETRLTAVGLWGLGGKEASAQTGEADELAARAGIIPKAKKGLGQSARDAVRDEFERSKLVTRAREVLDVVNAALPPGGEGYVLGADRAASVDAKLFGYLAPLLFAEPKLPVDTLPRLIRSSYPHLATHLAKVKEELFPTNDSLAWISPTEAQSTPPALPATRSASTSSGLLSYFWPSTPKASSSATSPPQPSSQHTRSNAASAAPRPTSEKRSAPPPEDRRLRLGRVLWICSALVGLVGYTFASGIVSVQFVDPDADEVEEGEDEEYDEDDEDEDEDGEDEEEDEEDGWQVQGEDDLEDDMDEMELDDDEDEY